MWVNTGKVSTCLKDKHFLKETMYMSSLYHAKYLARFFTKGSLKNLSCHDIMGDSYVCKNFKIYSEKDKKKCSGFILKGGHQWNPIRI